jgi:NAD-dependent dihydropyrimidine dehydrogenase PreA subunit
MPTITIDESGCRACNLCVEICPTEVLEMDAGGDVAKVMRQDDCIGCTSCMYLCPSRCLEVTDYSVQRPFYRIEENTALIAKFLQKKPTLEVLGPDDYTEALQDISTRLMALADTTAETVGRAQKALGRQAGNLAAAHLPEMYESTATEEILERLQHRFAHCFAFESTIKGEGEITFDFTYCALNRVVTHGGGKVGDSTLCTIFHEYWAGLLGAFTKQRYMIEMTHTGDTCEMKLEARR